MLDGDGEVSVARLFGETYDEGAVWLEEDSVGCPLEEHHFGVHAAHLPHIPPART